MTIDVLMFCLPMPSLALSPNARVHWRTRADAARQSKRDAQIAMLQQAGGRHKLPHWQRARLDLIYVFPLARRRDADNLRARAKQIQDAIVAVGIIPDDNTTCLEAGSTTVEIRKGVPHVVATLTRLDTAGEGQ